MNPVSLSHTASASGRREEKSGHISKKWDHPKKGEARKKVEFFLFTVHRTDAFLRGSAGRRVLTVGGNLFPAGIGWWHLLPSSIRLFDRVGQ